MGLSFEDAAVLGRCVQQHGLTETALRQFEAKQIPRVKAVFGLAGRQAAAMASGTPQKQLMEERAQLLYGQATFEPLAAVSAAATARGA